MMYRATVTRQTDIVRPLHPLATEKSITGACFLPEPGCRFQLFPVQDEHRGLTTSRVEAVLGSTYKEDGKTFDTVTFKTENTTYLMKIHNEVK